MKLFYYVDPKKNFGDELNAWLWDRLAPDLFDDDASTLVLGIGSIIHDEVPRAKNKIIFSSGLGCGYFPQDYSEEWKIISVRGPLTKQILKLPKGKDVTDGAILLATLKECRPIDVNERDGDVVYMPHHTPLDYSSWQEVCERANIGFVSPRTDSTDVIKVIKNSKLVIADAMHAAIVADTVRVNWIPVCGTPISNFFKWHDWAGSMNLKYKPIKIEPSNLEEKVTRFAMSIFGGLYANGDSPQEAIKNFKKFKDRPKLIWRIENRGRVGLAILLRKIVKLYLKTNVGQIHNEKQKNKAVKSLIIASQTVSYLSDDILFKNKLNEMKERLDILKSYKCASSEYFEQGADINPAA